MTLDEMEAQATALREAINSGTYQVRHGDKSVMYQTTNAMIQALNRLEAEIRRAKGSTVRRRYAYTAGKGL